MNFKNKGPVKVCGDCGETCHVGCSDAAPKTCGQTKTIKQASHLMVQQFAMSPVTLKKAGTATVEMLKYLDSESGTWWPIDARVTSSGFTGARQEDRTPVVDVKFGAANYITVSTEEEGPTAAGLASSDQPFYFCLTLQIPCWPVRSFHFLAKSHGSRDRLVRDIRDSAAAASIAGGRPFADSQDFSETVLPKFSSTMGGEINGLFQIDDNKVIIATDLGMRLIDGGTSRPLVPTLDTIREMVQVKCDGLPQKVAVMVAGKDRQLYSCVYDTTALNRNLSPFTEAQKIKGVNNVLRICSGSAAGKTMLLVATETKIVLLGYDHDEQGWVNLKTSESPSLQTASIGPMSFFSLSDGSSKFVWATKSIWSLDVSSAVTARKLLDQSDPSLRSLENAGPGIFPMAIFTCNGGGEFILCYNTHALFVGPDGKRIRTKELHWEQTPCAFMQAGENILLTTHNTVCVFNTAPGLESQLRRIHVEDMLYSLGSFHGTGYWCATSKDLSSRILSIDGDQFNQDSGTDASFSSPASGGIFGGVCTPKQLGLNEPVMGRRGMPRIPLPLARLALGTPFRVMKSCSDC